MAKIQRSDNDKEDVLDIFGDKENLKLGNEDKNAVSQVRTVRLVFFRTEKREKGSGKINEKNKKEKIIS